MGSAPPVRAKPAYAGSVSPPHGDTDHTQCNRFALRGAPPYVMTPWTRTLRIATATCAVALVSLFSATAEAADPPKFDKGAHLYLAPGLFYIPVGDSDTADAFDASYQWGLGGGYFFRRRALMMEVGGSLEHIIANFDDCDRSDCRGGMVRAQPEFRIGAGNDRIFGYGRVAAGLAYSFAEVDLGIVDGDSDDIGFNFGFGGGAQFLLWRGLALGAEANVDLAFFDDDHLVEAVHTFGLKALVGWYF